MLSCRHSRLITAAQVQQVQSNLCPNGTIYKTLDGRIITSDKMDSIQKAFGTMTMMHKPAEPCVVYLAPENDADKKKQAANKLRLAALVGTGASIFQVRDLHNKS